jgi:CDGSH-type Zn-finger protein
MNIKLLENGPIILDTKDLVSYTAENSSDEKTGPVFLCRCGQSSKKPFCDGAHKKAGFEAPSGELAIQ